MQSKVRKPRTAGVFTLVIDLDHLSEQIIEVHKSYGLWTTNLIARRGHPLPTPYSLGPCIRA